MKTKEFRNYVDLGKTTIAEQIGPREWKIANLYLNDDAFHLYAVNNKKDVIKIVKQLDKIVNNARKEMLKEIRNAISYF